MIIQFTLSMPNVGSWNGRWSGQDKLCATTRSFTGQLGTAKAKAILQKRSWHYSFGDGWGAGVAAKEITGSEARRVKRDSKGFCGYDWMVDSICKDGAIYSDLRPKTPVGEPWPPAAVSKPAPVEPTAEDYPL